MRIALFVILSCFASAQQNSESAFARRVHAEMSFLASDEMQGRGSATAAEATAAVYLASEFEGMGLRPAGDVLGSTRSWIQNVPFNEDRIETPPTLRVGTETWRHGTDFAISRISDRDFTGRLAKWNPNAAVSRGSVVFMTADSDRIKIREILSKGAVSVLIGFSEATRERFERNQSLPKLLDDEPHLNILYLSAQATAAVTAMAEGTDIVFHADFVKHTRQTRNVIAVLPGRTEEAIIISAHYDHVGTKPGQPDPVYNGADDDASGTVAVLEIARSLASGSKPRRTVYFVLFGAEELGLIGGKYFQLHPPFALEKVVTNIEFEMIGRPDPKISADSLWMTGFDRSDLGKALAKRGAKIVPDPHPQDNFFERSDNYSLAKQGVVAHAVSSFGLHKQYHQPDDDIAHIDFDHMTRAIASMIAPIRWLANTGYKPAWLPGKKP
jgi:aminopeptidase YwaD